MAIVENWLPPSKENWELINFAWQFFPIVRSTMSACARREILLPEKAVLTRRAVYRFTMGHRVVPDGQDLHRLKV